MIIQHLENWIVSHAFQKCVNGWRCSCMAKKKVWERVFFCNLRKPIHVNFFCHNFLVSGKAIDFFGSCYSMQWTFFFTTQLISFFWVEKPLPSSVLQVLRLHPFLGHKLKSKIETGIKPTKHRSTTKQWILEALCLDVLDMHDQYLARCFRNCWHNLFCTSYDFFHSEFFIHSVF